MSTHLFGQAADDRLVRGRNLQRGEASLDGVVASGRDDATEPSSRSLPNGGHHGMLNFTTSEVKGVLVVAFEASDDGATDWQMSQRDWLYINPDLTIHVARPPAGEWIALRSVTYAYGTGTGLAESALYDATGRFGRSVQSLLLDSRR